MVAEKKEDVLAGGCQQEGSLTEFDINNTASLKGSFLHISQSGGFQLALPLVPIQAGELPAITRATFTHS